MKYFVQISICITYTATEKELKVLSMPSFNKTYTKENAKQAKKHFFSSCVHASFKQLLFICNIPTAKYIS